MPDLIAQGPSSQDRWRRAVPDSDTDSIVIGRLGSDWDVGWDSLISRQHVRLRCVDQDRIEVTCFPTARNPVFHRGRKSPQFVLVPGEHFVIGRTTFTLVNRPDPSDVLPDHAEFTEHAFDHTSLRQRRFRDAASRIDMLSRLPDLITSSTSDEELLLRVSSVLLQATPAATAVAIVASSPLRDTPEPSAKAASSTDTKRSTPSSIEVLHYETRRVGNVCPPVSSRLVRTATAKGESVLHLWTEAPRGSAAAFTVSDDVDWAFCVPLRSEACPGWALYISGQLACQRGFDLDQSMQAAPQDLEDDVKFAELVGTTLANIRQSSRLQRRQAAMQRFFSPIVMEALATMSADDVLEPREANLSVLFCDLRGFSRRSEQDADQLLRLLAQVSDALGVMTRHILETGGVIGDFHGDAAMGFWGWPLAQLDSPVRAVEAAMKIRLANQAANQFGGFRCGIGIATGRAVAGRIGTVDQVKVTAFGPVVNLASRLEGVTKGFGVEIIIDQTTATALQTSLDHQSTTGNEQTGNEQTSAVRTRRLARVRPAGLESPVDVFEVLPSLESGERTLSDEQIQQYERSLDALIRGDWDQAYEGLHALPAWDRPKDRLLATILQYNRVAPPDWTGVIDVPKF